MHSADLLKEFARSPRTNEGLVPKLMSELLLHLAAGSDSSLTNQLLKELVIRYAEAERRLAVLNRQLVQKQLLLDADVQAAAEIQQALLPHKSLTIPAADFAWKFQPCDLIGGDLFNVLTLDHHRLGVFILDVSGHGVPAAMMSVSVSQALRLSAGLVVRQGVSSSLSAKNEVGEAYQGPDVQRYVESPAKVAEGLDREFPFTRFDKFFTIFYGVLDTLTGEFRYCNAGHPPPVHVGANGALCPLTEGGTIIGMGGLVPFEEGSLTLKVGDKIVFYTDGILEFHAQDGGFFGEERFYGEISLGWRQPIAALLDDLSLALRSFGGETPLQDDVTLLGLEFRGLDARGRS